MKIICHHKNEMKIKIFIARRGYMCLSVFLCFLFVFYKAEAEKRLHFFGLVLFFVSATLPSLWDLSSPTRD